MRKTYLFAAAAVALASCANDEFLGNVTQTQVGNGEISFATFSENVTRAGDATGADAAEKLSNEFVVYGFKSGGFTKGADEGNAGTYADTKSDVFKNYSVNWVGKPGSTESNTHGWEYVGYTSKPIGEAGVEQSIKYWDYSAAEYDFLAWSVTGNATIEAITEDGVNPYKPHSLVFTAPTADDLANVYVANQVTVKKDGSNATTGGTGKLEAQAYKEKVLLTFRNMAARVRIGIYETVPGYSVKDVHFYADASNVDDANPSTLYATTGTPFATAGTVTAKFYDGTVGTENDVVVTTESSEVDSKAQFGILTKFQGPEYMEEEAEYIGRASNLASMSAGTDNGWTYEFPMAATELNLKVDYTLVSRDGSGEEIKVTGASAKVPANYGEWKANYAYTYLFKISDNTNGSTGDPNDPTNPDPSGLYPITFDAVVVAVQDGNTQETITTVATPSITTYQNGSMVTEENEYHASTTKNIYVTCEGLALSTTNTKLYTAIDLGSDHEGITEETVANYMNNDIVLSDASALLSNAANIPADETIDNVAITLSPAGVKFMPKANTIYVIEVTNSTNKYYKVIKVEATASATATYNLAVKDGSESTIAEGGSTIITVVDANDYKVTGAQNYFTGADEFTVSETAEGEYTFVAKAGATQGTKSIKLNGSTALEITVNEYEFADASVTIAEGGNNTITLNLASTDATDVDAATNFAFDGGSGLSISNVADGVVTIAAANGAKSGKITFSNGSVVVATADVIVSNYSLAVKTGSYAIINGSGSTTTLVAKLGSDFAATSTALESSNVSVATVAAVSGTEGEAVVTYASVGTTNITLGSATQAIECTNFAVTLYSDEACTTEVGASNLTTSTGTYYAKFTDNGTDKNVTGLTAQGCTIAKKSATGVYKVTVTATGTATIKYTYKGVTFTLAEKTVE